jgi:hypothetical protein
MRHVKEQKKDCKVFLYERKYEGNGVYFQRGICKNLQVGDEWASFTDPKTVLQVVEVESISDSQGKWDNPEDGKKSLFKAKFYDPNFVEHGANYAVLRQI